LCIHVFSPLELQYSTAVIPTGINIHENYHPGAVVRILACNSVSGAIASGEVRCVNKNLRSILQKIANKLTISTRNDGSYEGNPYLAHCSNMGKSL